MAQGLQVYNDSNILQIDSTYRNLALTSSGTAIASAGGLARYVEINVVGENPIIALRHPIGATAIATNKVGSTFTFRLFTWNTEAGYEPTINYWVFDNFNSPEYTHGLHVFDSSGKVCYDSSKKYFKVLNNNVGSQITYPNKSVLTAICAFGFNRVAFPNPANPDVILFQESIHFAKMINNNTVEGFMGLTNLGNNPYSTSWATGGRIMAIDVTNYGI